MTGVLPLRQELDRAPMQTVRPSSTRQRQELAPLLSAHAVRRMAPGFYTAIPHEHGPDWRPTLETSALAVATALFGQGVPVLMGPSAARLHGALPRVLGYALISVDDHCRQIRLCDGGVVRFVTRDPAGLGVQRVQVDALGTGLVTTPEQTVVDLVRHRDPALGIEPVRDAIARLLPRCDPATLAELDDAEPWTGHHALVTTGRRRHVRHNPRSTRR